MDKAFYAAIPVKDYNDKGAGACYPYVTAADAMLCKRGCDVAIAPRNGWIADYPPPRNAPAARSGGFSSFFSEHGHASFGGSVSTHVGNVSTGFSGGISSHGHRF